MGFRERPEYQDWRDAVFNLYGRKCIRCGHPGNIHAHHVMPVEDYPELAFEPANGVPLCGNCHVAIKGDEVAHVDELKRLQRAASGGEPADDVEGTSNGSALRERAYAEPSNAEAVNDWFNATADSMSVVDFWEANRAKLNTSYQLRMSILPHLAALGRWQDVITEAECGSRLLSGHVADIGSRVGPIHALPEAVLAAGKEQVMLLEAQAPKLASAHAALDAQFASLKGAALTKLGRYAEAVSFLREVAVRLPESADVHVRLSEALYKVFQQTNGSDVLEEGLRYAVRAIGLAPDDYNCAKAVATLSHYKGDHRSALQHGERAISLARTREEKIEALQNIANMYVDKRLHRDARGYLQKALQLDGCRTDVIADIAGCYFLEGNKREAVRMAKRGLMLDPQNKICHDICRASRRG